MPGSQPGILRGQMDPRFEDPIHTQSRCRMPPLRLPMELIARIMDLCTDYSHPDYETLRSLALLSHTVFLRAQRNMYQHVVLGSARRFATFLNTIKNNSHLGGLVTRLTISSLDRYMPVVLLAPLLPYVRVMSLTLDLESYPMTYAYLLYAFRGVRHLELKHMCLKDVLHLKHFVQAFPRLESLTLDSILFQRGRSRRSTCQPQLRWVPQSIRSLRIQGLGGSLETLFGAMATKSAFRGTLQKVEGEGSSASMSRPWSTLPNIVAHETRP
ncbi:hypothetical protein C8Q77DRAFT_551076 [Trametes polyzona]|nr:hypothetical protein C8Q77DRAFT_551076 [Trametes polyzona]